MKLVGLVLVWLLSLALIAIAVFATTLSLGDPIVNSHAQLVLDPLYRRWFIVAYATLGIAGLAINPLVGRMLGPLRGWGQAALAALALGVGAGLIVYGQDLFNKALANNWALRLEMEREYAANLRDFGIENDLDSRTVAGDLVRKRMTVGTVGSIRYFAEVDWNTSTSPQRRVGFCFRVEGASQCMTSEEADRYNADGVITPGIEQFLRNAGESSASLAAAAVAARAALADPELPDLVSARDFCESYMPVVDHDWRVVRAGRLLPDPAGGAAHCVVPTHRLPSMAG
jgi:hypothetical protein